MSSGTYSLSQTSQLQENYVVVFWWHDIVTISLKQSHAKWHHVGSSTGIKHLKIKYIQMSVYISIYMHWGMSQMLCANLLKFEVYDKNNYFNHMLKNDFQSMSDQYMSAPIEWKPKGSVSVRFFTVIGRWTPTTRRVHWSFNTHFTWIYLQK